MKKYLFSIGILFLLVGNLTGQDFIFSWKFKPSFGKRYNVKVVRERNKRHIIVESLYLQDSIRKRIDKSDCDSLFKFCCVYNFLEKSGTIRTKVRKPIDVQIIPKSKKVIIDGDTLWDDALYLDDRYVFDKDSNRYYEEIIYSTSTLDGISYDGFFKFDNELRKYKIRSIHKDTMDYKLNKLVYGLMRKYFDLEDITDVGESIDSDFRMTK